MSWRDNQGQILHWETQRFTLLQIVATSPAYRRHYRAFSGPRHVILFGVFLP